MHVENGGLKNLYSVIKCVEEEDDRIGLETVSLSVLKVVRYIGKVHYKRHHLKYI